MSICIAHYAKNTTNAMSPKQMRFQVTSKLITDQAQQLDHANCQAENSKLLGPQWRKHEHRKCCDGRMER